MPVQTLVFYIPIKKLLLLRVFGFRFCIFSRMARTSFILFVVGGKRWNYNSVSALVLQTFASIYFPYTRSFEELLSFRLSALLQASNFAYTSDITNSPWSGFRKCTLVNGVLMFYLFCENYLIRRVPSRSHSLRHFSMHELLCAFERMCLFAFHF